MTAQILDGTKTAAAIKAELTERVAKLREQGVVPGLGTVLVGDDPGSRWYVNGKHKDCAEVGINSIRVDLPATATQAEVEAAVDQLNANPECTGYIVQLPLPKHMDENAVLGRIDPAKDADGLHPTNLGWLVLGKEAPLPCTPFGIVELLRRHDVPIAGAEVCVVGRGVTVAFSLRRVSSSPSGRPTVTPRPTTTTSAPAIGTSWRRSSSTMPYGVHGNGASLPNTSQPRLVGCRPSASLSGSIRPSTAFSSMCFGNGSCTM